MTKEQEEILVLLMQNATTKKEAIAAAIDATSISTTEGKMEAFKFINLNWRRVREDLSSRVISLRGRNYTEIASILLELTEKLKAKKISSVTFNIIKAQNKTVPRDFRSHVCKNTWDVSLIAGEPVKLIEFNKINLLVESLEGKQYEMLIWDIKKTHIDIEK